MTEEDKAEIRAQVKEFRQYEDLIRNGDYYRLTSPYEGTHTAWAFVSENKEEVLLNVVWHEVHANQEVGFVKLRGLESNAVYKDVANDKTYYGDVLMEAGIPMPLMEEYDAVQIYLTKLI